jgi:hypothetical protein
MIAMDTSPGRDKLKGNCGSRAAERGAGGRFELYETFATVCIGIGRSIPMLPN